LSIYLFDVASQKAEWLSARQTAIATNIANANTPGYRAVDVKPFSAILDSSPIAMATTAPGQLAPAEFVQAAAAQQIDAGGGEETLSGNTINLEHELINLSETGRDYTMTANVQRAFHQFILSALK
jgi:flagellar basal-body rod protein FlgB